MNPLMLIALIGGGLYLYNQSQPKKHTSDVLGNPYSPFPVPNEPFFDKDKYGSFAIKMVNGKPEYAGDKVFNTEIDNAKIIYDQNLINSKWKGTTIKALNPGGFEIIHNNLFGRLYNFKFGLEPQGLKWIYDQNPGLANEIFKKLITRLFERSSSEVKAKIIQNLPDIIDEYFTYLKKAGVPESQWPEQHIQL